MENLPDWNGKPLKKGKNTEGDRRTDGATQAEPNTHDDSETNRRSVRSPIDRILTDIPYKLATLSHRAKRLVPR